MMQAIVAYDITQRSRPKAETVMKIAEAFGVSLNAMYQEPFTCLQEAVVRFKEAPITRAVEPPPVELRPMERRKGVGVEFEEGSKEHR